MKKRVALVALLIVGLGAVLMFAAFVTGTDVSATGFYPLGIGRHHVDVGTVQVDNDGTNLNVRYQLDAGACLAEVHVCVSTEPFGWTPPGQCRWVDTDGDGVVVIPLAEIGVVDMCEPVYIQAHAVVDDCCGGNRQTAYGSDNHTFKDVFEHTLCGCAAP